MNENKVIEKNCEFRIIKYGSIDDNEEQRNSRQWIDGYQYDTDGPLYFMVRCENGFCWRVNYEDIKFTNSMRPGLLRRLWNLIW